MEDSQDYKSLEIVDALLADYNHQRPIDRVELHNQPDVDVIHEITRKLLRIVFPGFFREKNFKFYNVATHVSSLVEDVAMNLEKQINLALLQCPNCLNKNPSEIQRKATGVIQEFFRTLPKTREMISSDVEAAFEGDPAAFNQNEVILAYPGIWAVAINRLAHELYKMNVPLIPRIMTEYAHGKTGIDIHPGTQIGKYFFIDHGTGIVIGETAVIGDHVKIYQGVTLGATSTRAGQSLKGKKRHPTIEDFVTIYAGASILGGETVVGKNAVIGANCFITSSVESGSKVSIANQELNIKSLVQHEMRGEECWFYVI